MSLPKLINNQEEYKVKQILDCTIKNKTKYYLVK